MEYYVWIDKKIQESAAQVCLLDTKVMVIVESWHIVGKTKG